jgi:hypothetical protein
VDIWELLREPAENNVSVCHFPIAATEGNGNLLDNLRGNGLARSTPGSESVENDNLVVLDG